MREDRKIYKGNCQVMNIESGPWFSFGVEMRGV